jgi:hypothetical protein
MAWHLGHFWMAMAGAVLWVLRARFFLFEVRLFGTAIVLSVVIQVNYSGELLRKLIANCAQRVPSCVGGDRLALARAEVQIGSARRAQPLAIVSALHVRRSG